MFGTKGNVAAYGPWVPHGYYPIIGRIIISWSFLEQNIDLCIPKILDANNTSIKEWRREVTKKRIQLFEREMKQATINFSSVKSDSKQFFLNVWRAKQVRDWLCHEKISFNLGDKKGRSGIEFINKSFGKKRKPINIEELKRIDGMIQTSQVILHTFKNCSKVERYSSEEKLFLSSSLGRVHLL